MIPTQLEQEEEEEDDGGQWSLRWGLAELAVGVGASDQDRPTPALQPQRRSRAPVFCKLPGNLGDRRVTTVAWEQRRMTTCSQVLDKLGPPCGLHRPLPSGTCPHVLEFLLSHGATAGVSWG